MQPIPVSKWEEQGNVWPSRHSWYHMLRPENLREELVSEGVVSCINGRWIVFPDKWQVYMSRHHKPRQPR